MTFPDRKEVITIRIPITICMYLYWYLILRYNGVHTSSLRMGNLGLLLFIALTNIIVGPTLLLRYDDRLAASTPRPLGS